MAGAKDNHSANGVVAGASVHGGATQVLQKRLRSVKKKLRFIDELEGKVQAGHSLNADQEASLQSKPGLLAVQEELERLAAQIEAAVKEDVEAATAAAAAAAREQALAEAAAVPPPEPVKPAKLDVEWEAEKQDAVAKARKEEGERAREEGHAAGRAEGLAAGRAEAEAAARAETEAAVRTAVEAAMQQGASDAASALVELLYFASVFDPFIPYPLAQERHACLSYAAHKQVALTGEDLDLVGILGKLLTTRPYATAISHAEALAQCKEMASRFVLHSQVPVAPTHAAATGAQVHSKVAAIKQTDFFTVVPSLQGAQPIAPGGLPVPAMISAVPLLAPVAAAPPAPAPAPAAAAPAPSKLPTPQAAAASGQNLVEFFTTPSAAPAKRQPSPNRQPMQEQQAGVGSTPPPADHAAAAGGQAQAGPPAFAGDSELGIEGVPIEPQQEARPAPAPQPEPAPEPAAEEAPAPVAAVPAPAPTAAAPKPVSFAQAVDPNAGSRPEAGPGAAAGRGRGPPRPASRGGRGPNEARTRSSGGRGRTGSAPNDLAPAGALPPRSSGQQSGQQGGEGFQRSGSSGSARTGEGAARGGRGGFRGGRGEGRGRGRGPGAPPARQLPMPA